MNSIEFRIVLYVKKYLLNQNECILHIEWPHTTISIPTVCDFIFPIFMTFLWAKRRNKCQTVEINCFSLVAPC